MLRKTPADVRECHERAAACQQRADGAPNPDTKDFWLRRGEGWTKLAQSSDVSSRIATFLDLKDGTTFSPEAQAGVLALIDIFDCVCRALDLDLSDETRPRLIARTLIEAALAGESDPQALFDRAIKAVTI